ncbi:MAG: acetyl-CoA synthase subunit delta [Clostridiales bacterium]|nr:acetyl-CoA synthase subunit delta [Clostridiales bacterium]
MAFTAKTEAYPASVIPVTIGTGEKAITLGGNHALPFCSFDAPIQNAPKIGMEIPDAGIRAYLQAGLCEFYQGCTCPAEMAKRAASVPGVSFLCLHLESADPNGENKSAAECAALARSVAGATDLPLVIMGCKNAAKDAEIFAAIAEALQGRNILLLSACEENYKSVCTAALSYGQKIGAESAVDINLAKQLNVLITQLGAAPSSVVMNVGSAAAGYGYEYVASTIDRIRAAALAQSDDLLQMPIITPVADEAWSVKEAIVPEADMPAWGDAEKRGIEMEITTAAAYLTCGSDAVILRHPAAVSAIADMLAALI